LKIATEITETTEKERLGERAARRLAVLLYSVFSVISVADYIGKK